MENNRKMILIYIPVFGNIGELKQCLGVIRRNTKYPNYDVTLIDDGNPRSIAAQLKGLARTLRHGRNRGFTASINTARKDFLAHAGKKDIFIILNSDTQPQKYWLKELIRAVKRYKDTGIFSALMLSAADPRKVIGGGTRHPLNNKGGLIPLNRMVKIGKTSDHKKDLLAPWAEFAAALITYPCLIKCGRFDSTFRHFGSDVEYGYRAGKFGFKTRYISASKVLHKKQASLYNMASEQKNMLSKDLKILKNKLTNSLC